MKKLSWALLLGAVLVTGGCADAVPGAAAPDAAVSATSTAPATSGASDAPSAESPTESAEPTAAPTRAEDTAPEPDPALAVLREELTATLLAGYADVTSIRGASVLESGVMVMDMEVTAALVDGVASASRLEAVVTVGNQTVTVDVLVVDGRGFVGGDFAAQYTDRRYVELNEDASAPELVEMYNSMRQSLDQFGAGFYPNMVDAFTDITWVGSQQIDGLMAERYDVIVDVDALYGNTRVAGLGEVAQQMEALGVSSYPMTLWIADGRVVQVVQDMTLMGQRMVTTTGPMVFNEPVDIVLPDPADIEQG